MGKRQKSASARPRLTVPRTLGGVRRLISDEVPESLWLDYKASAAITHKTLQSEIPHDASAFANSDGGMLIYGVAEENHRPVRIDEGVDHRIFPRERLEQAILSNVRPLLADLRIAQITLTANRSLYVVEVPRSPRAPHQAPGGRYYRRYNFISVPMAEYEIRDLYNRRSATAPLVRVETEPRHGIVIDLVVWNPGDLPAHEVSVSFNPPIPWRGGETPRLLARPVHTLAPGKRFVFRYATFPEVFAADSKLPAQFSASASYVHSGTGERVVDEFYIDLRDYQGSQAIRSELQEHAATLEKQLKELVGQVRRLVDHLERLSNLSGPTGLAISIPTLRNLAAIGADSPVFGKLDALQADYTVFQEVLAIDGHLAFRLYTHFHHGRREGELLTSIEGMTPELEAAVNRHFRF